MVGCNGRHTGSRFARHESEQTSSWCFVARKAVKLVSKRKANDGFTAGAPLGMDPCLIHGKPLIVRYRKVYLGIGLILSDILGRTMVYWVIGCCVFDQFGRRVVQYRPLKGLSGMMGNYHVPFLGGEGP
jgi:hypothetical protein